MNNLKTYLTASSEVKAVQWHTNGDHPLDQSELITLGTETDGVPDTFLSEGKVVRRFRHPYISGTQVCDDCGYTMHEHGWIDEGEDGSPVCPGNYVVTNEFGDTYPTSEREFLNTYRIKE